MPSAEHTQHLDAKEVAAMAAKGGRPDSEADIPMPPVQVNPLPDVYPEQAQRRAQ